MNIDEKKEISLLQKQQVLESSLQLEHTKTMFHQSKIIHYRQKFAPRDLPLVFTPGKEPPDIYTSGKSTTWMNTPTPWLLAPMNILPPMDIYPPPMHILPPLRYFTPAWIFYPTPWIFPPWIFTPPGYFDIVRDCLRTRQLLG